MATATTATAKTNISTTTSTPSIAVAENNNNNMTTQTTMMMMIDVDYLVERLGMTNELAVHTMSGIDDAILTDDDDAQQQQQKQLLLPMGTIEWLKQVPREELMEIGVEPFAADRIALFQTLIISSDKSNDNNQEENNNSNHNSNNKAFINGSILAGGALLSATPATAAVGTAGLGMLGFSSTGVVYGSVAAAMQGPATAAGSWFALCQSAGATGAIAGPVGAVAGVATAAIGLGAASLIVYFKNKHDEHRNINKENKDKNNSNENEKNNKNNKNDQVENEPVPLTAAFLLKGIPDLSIDDATKLVERFNTIHVLTTHDFLIVSVATMVEMFDDASIQHLDKITSYQQTLHSTLYESSSASASSS